MVGSVTRDSFAPYGPRLILKSASRKTVLTINRNTSSDGVETPNDFDFHLKVSYRGDEWTDVRSFVLTPEQAIALVDLIQDSFRDGMEILEAKNTESW